MSSRGWRYVVNSTGPNTESNGTPHFNFVMLDCAFLIVKFWVWPFKYYSNQLRAAPVIPIREFNTDSNRSWSTVSKAALRSSRTKITGIFSWKAPMMSLYTRTRAVSTLCPSLYADWNISARLHFFRWCTYCSHASDSSNLDKKAMLLRGLRYLKFSGSKPSFFRSGFKIAVLRS